MNPFYLKVREEIRCSIMSKIDFSREVEDSEVLDLIDRHLTQSGKESILLLTLEERKRLRQDHSWPSYTAGYRAYSRKGDLQFCRRD